MYQFSRAIYRELAPFVDERAPYVLGPPRAALLRACETTLERLANDRHYFARPSRTLFMDIRPLFPIGAQERVCRTVTHYVDAAQMWLDEQPPGGVDLHGNRLQCRATTRKGTPCQRMPLPRNGYCPSHQHLAETEDLVEAA